MATPKKKKSIAKKVRERAAKVIAPVSTKAAAAVAGDKDSDFVVEIVLNLKTHTARGPVLIDVFRSMIADFPKEVFKTKGLLRVTTVREGKKVSCERYLYLLQIRRFFVNDVMRQIFAKQLEVGLH